RYAYFISNLKIIFVSFYLYVDTSKEKWYNKNERKEGICHAAWENRRQIHGMTNGAAFDFK
ncbi:MAG: hypothetical protein ACI4TG_07680, partial [Ruminococcus sp.]